MATKKYVSLEKLGLYDEKIKKVIADADEAALKAANKYADDLAVNYDVAGAAATAEANAKAHADTKDAAIQAAQKAADDAAAAAGVADGKAVKAQGDVDTLKTYVGTIPSDATATNVVAYVQEKTAGIASEGTVTELGNRMTTVEGKVATIEGDYLKAVDKNELAGDIADAMAAVDAEKARAEGIEGGLRTDVDAIKGDYLKAEHQTALQNNIDAVAEDVADIVADYLKAADKTELQGKIDLKVAQADYDAKMEEIDGDIDGLQNQINLIMNNPDTKDVIDSIAEFTQYVADHGEIADGFRTDINKNKDDIAAEVKRAGEAEAALVERLDVLEAIDHDAYIAADEVLAGRIKTLEEIDHAAYVAADTALKNELNAEIAKKADATAFAEAVEALEGDIADLQEADADIIERVAAVEALMGDGDGSVADQIADAKAELQGELAQAIADAKTDASNKDAVVLAEAQKASTAVQTNLDTHTNNGDIHVTAADKTKWNAALQAADVATGTANGTISVKGNDVAVKGLGSAAYVATTAFDAAGSAAQALTDAKAHADAEIAKFVEVSEQEILDLFK